MVGTVKAFYDRMMPYTYVYIFTYFFIFRCGVGREFEVSVMYHTLIEIFS